MSEAATQIDHALESSMRTADRAATEAARAAAHQGEREPERMRTAKVRGPLPASLQPVPSAPAAGVYRKIAAVMGEIDRLPKSGKNAHFGYAYATEGDVKAALRPLLAKHGLVCLATVDEHEQDGDITRLHVRLRLVDAATGESVESAFIGEGQDKQDKGPAKALTLALKYGLLATFLIDTGEDPDGDTHDAPARRREPEAPATRTTPPQTRTAPPPTGEARLTTSTGPAPTSAAPSAAPRVGTGAMTDAQGRKLYALARSVGAADGDMKAMLRTQYGLASSKDLTRQQASDLIERLTKVESRDLTLAELTGPVAPAAADPLADLRAEGEEAAQRAGISAEEWARDWSARFATEDGATAALQALYAQAVPF